MKPILVDGQQCDLSRAEQATLGPKESHAPPCCAFVQRVRSFSHPWVALRSLQALVFYPATSPLRHQIFHPFPSLSRTVQVSRSLVMPMAFFPVEPPLLPGLIGRVTEGRRCRSSVTSPPMTKAPLHEVQIGSTISSPSHVASSDDRDGEGAAGSQNWAINPVEVAGGTSSSTSSCP